MLFVDDWTLTTLLGSPDHHQKKAPQQKTENPSKTTFDVEESAAKGSLTAKRAPVIL